MTSQDPFTNPPSEPSDAAAAPPAPPANPPGVLAPGLLTPESGPAAPVPPAGPRPVGSYTATAAPAQPTKGLATTAIALTGAYTALGFIAATVTPAMVDELKETLADTSSYAVDPISAALQFLSFALGITSFIFLALWMTRIRANRTQIGETPGGPPAVEWWGWFVPVANFVLPYLGMRAITRRLVGVGVLLGWWLPFCITWILSGAVSVIPYTAVDFETQELTNPEALDQMVPLAWASAVATLVSWLFLVVIIRKATAKHLDR